MNDVQRLFSALTLVFTLVLAAACSSGLRPPAGGVGAPAPAAAVERFLQLAGEDQYLEMGWFFGTAEGPILERDPPSEVEKRMYALAMVLRNGGYVVGPGATVPGRVGAAQRFTVRLQKEQRQVEVPVIVVRGPGERWLVEQIDVQAITGTR
ncbi:MAG TPA: hypothetical protein VF167_12840 [Longimicrobiaceae bacterium]